MLKSTLRGRRLLVAALTVVLIACSSVAALAASTVNVKVGDNYFRAKSLTISRGTKVTWTWVGVHDHDVKVASGPVHFRSRIQARGTYSHVFSQPGVYHLECIIHPHMKMTIVVK